MVKVLIDNHSQDVDECYWDKLEREMIVHGVFFMAWTLYILRSTMFSLT
jgi:hypothetical protein